MNFRPRLCARKKSSYRLFPETSSTEMSSPVTITAVVSTPPGSRDSFSGILLPVTNFEGSVTLKLNLPSEYDTEMPSSASSALRGSSTALWPADQKSLVQAKSASDEGS